MIRFFSDSEKGSEHLTPFNFLRTIWASVSLRLCVKESLRERRDAVDEPQKRWSIFLGMVDAS